MRQIFILILMELFLLCSCQEKKKVTMRSFERVESIKGIPYEQQPIIGYPHGGMAVVENKRLLLAGVDKEHIGLMLDLEDGTEKGAIGKWGTQGPYELSMADITGISEKNRTVGFYDPNLRKEVIFTYDDVLNFTPKEEYTRIIKDVWLMNMCKLENYNVATLFFSTDSLERPHALLDKNLQAISYFGESTLKNITNHKPIISLGKIHGYDDDFVFGIQDFGYLAYYTVKDGEPRLKWEHYFEKPIFDSHGFLEMRELSRGVYSLEITENYVFCNYSGVKHSSREKGNDLKRVYVFDRDGNPIVKLETDRGASCFAVSDDEKTIYAVSTTPEIEVMRYDISDIL